jgi:hypothetical protein
VIITGTISMPTMRTTITMIMLNDTGESSSHAFFVYSIVYPLGTLATMKDAGLRIRVQRELREQFLGVCRAQDKPAAQVLREFMRHYVAEYRPTMGKGGDLREADTKIGTQRPKP